MSIVSLHSLGAITISYNSDNQNKGRGDRGRKNSHSTNFSYDIS